MTQPLQLVDINLWVDGGSYLGEVAEFEEPKLAQKTEDWRGGGMPGSMKVERGLEAQEATITMGGHVASLVRKFGATSAAGVRLRLVMAYRANDDDTSQAVEVVLRGRFSEIDFGKAKPGDNTEHKYKVDVAYYRRVVDGATDAVIDLRNGIYMVGGIDRYADIMAILTS